MMGKHQLGLELEQGEVESIVAWLKSLTGPLPAQYTLAPQLPASTGTTPAANKT
jgi:cytochrome c peroxidase